VDAVAMSKCTHNPGGNNLVQQVSRHRGVWEPEQRPLGFWNSDFPSDEELIKQREEAEKQEAERAKKMAAEAETANGRFRPRVPKV
jgi:hypothetical protein